MSRFSVLLVTILVASVSSGCRNAVPPADQLYQQGYASLFLGQRGEAIKFYKKAAEQGHAKAQLALGILDDGGAVNPSLHTALTDPSRGQSEWYPGALASLETEAAEGDHVSRVALAIMLEKGIGIEADPTRAVNLLHSDPGTAADDYWLGWIFEHRGQYSAATSLYISASRQGVAEAYTALGLMYINGLGVENNFGAGMALIRIGYDRGHQEAGELYETLLDTVGREANSGNRAAIAKLESFLGTGLSRLSTVS